MATSHFFGSNSVTSIPLCAAEQIASSSDAGGRKYGEEMRIVWRAEARASINIYSNARAGVFSVVKISCIGQSDDICWRLMLHIVDGWLFRAW